MTMYRCAGCGYRLPTPRLCKACERRRDAKIEEAKRQAEEQPR